MTEFRIREAGASDSEPIRRLIDLVGINPSGLDWKPFIVALDPRDEVVGCGQIKPHGGNMRELASIAVCPEARGTGVARAIIERLISAYPRPLYLMCRSPLGPLYERFGFRSIGYDAMPRYFQRVTRLAGLAEALSASGETLLVMRLV